MSLFKISQLFTLLFAFLMLGACTQECEFITEQEAVQLNDIIKVKVMDNEGGVEQNVTTDYLKEKWEKQSREEGFDVKLERFELVESVNKSTQEKHYFLKGISADKTVETGAFLVQVSEGEYQLGQKRCTCKGCRLGCRLTVEGSKCHCSSCPGNYKVCTKTEEAVIEDI